MVTRISVGQFVARFAEVLNRVAFGGECFLVTRRGRPIVGIVSIPDLRTLDPTLKPDETKGGTGDGKGPRMDSPLSR